MSRELDAVLSPRVLRELIERAHNIDQHAAGARWDFEAARHELDNIRHRLSALWTIEDYEARIAKAETVIAEQDRPLRRRHHRNDLEGARVQLSGTPARSRGAARAQALATAPDEAIADRLGTRAREPDALAAWDDAAGPAQHVTAFGDDADEPSVQDRFAFQETACAASRRARR